MGKKANKLKAKLLYYLVRRCRHWYTLQLDSAIFSRIPKSKDYCLIPIFFWIKNFWKIFFRGNWYLLCQRWKEESRAYLGLQSNVKIYFYFLGKKIQRVHKYIFDLSALVRCGIWKASLIKHVRYCIDFSKVTCPGLHCWFFPLNFLHFFKNSSLQNN